MAHSEKQQPDFSNNPDSHNRLKSQALSRDIEELNKGLRIDFDQKLGELSDLLARFKALISAPSTKAANDAANNEDDKDSSTKNRTLEIRSANVTPLFSQLPAVVAKPESPVDLNSPACFDPEPENVEKDNVEKASQDYGNESVDDTQAAEALFPAPASAPHSGEPARFETGLYKLNCQLYRFRLELDQELEFREEPLHIHFRQESELSQLLQKLNEESSEKHPDS